jgi:hypothetical protein
LWALLGSHKPLQGLLPVARIRYGALAGNTWTQSSSHLARQIAGDFRDQILSRFPSGKTK